ncbi:uncharacterized protein LOC122616216 [Drosophila teissieri]|uniref:uncharacterized protein LOC122616216 n=1 Tax=Drosophila teissieri TaxID=7243 RepID=UPI001CBA23B7|nr:uncharacterized protein LOC122616216 [Drosophila teissieri]
MVNELNRPQNGDNAALSERLAASNRQLQEMQEEHRQLLEEMETLRLRAAELTLLNAQRRQVRETTEEEEHYQVESSAETASVGSSSSPPADSPNQEEAPSAEEEGDADKEEQASYLQAKLNEIANLKAQFKRVQNMVDTTKMIEQHMSSRQTVQVQSTTSVQTSRQTTSSEVRVAHAESVEAVESAQAENPSTSSTPPDNAELLNSMLNMFTDFTSDLRGQAEGLRAERDRIRALKEDIIQRKQGK